MKSRIGKMILAMAWGGLLLGLQLFGCAGEVDLPPDSSTQYLDTSWGAGDTQSWYPDTNSWTPPDTFWPSPDSSYSGLPFGCQRDEDCFGMRCCPTPWGVKLCATACEQIP